MPWSRPSPGHQAVGKGEQGLPTVPTMSCWCPRLLGTVHGACEHEEPPAGEFVCRHVPWHAGQKPPRREYRSSLGAGPPPL